MKTNATAVTDAPGALRPPGLVKRIIHWILDLDHEATLEEGRRRLRNARRFLPSLTPEQLEFMRSYDGPENLGPQLTRRERRDLERRIAAQNQGWGDSP
jgi:hypothetical protein